MKIGELAAATATLVETVRFYEREGLLPAPSRSGGNYRVYDETHVARLAFIRRCRTLDMNLDEIRVLLSFKDAPANDCGGVNALLDEHIGHVATRIKELRKLEIELRELRATCNAAQTAMQCGILKKLSDSERAPSTRKRQHVGQVHGRRVTG
jgi:Cd(II)/Pb(II)-responsive transcriptional regulator